MDTLKELLNAGFTDSEAQKAIACLPDIRAAASKITIKNDDDYKGAYALKGFLSRLYCYSFNNNHEATKEVGSIETLVGQKMARFARTYYTKISPEAKSLVRYMLWRKKFIREDLNKIVSRLVDEGAIFRAYDGEDSYQHVYVTGLHLAVGDNTFGIDANGRQYRLYNKVCVPQVFPVSIEIPDEIKDAIPEGKIPDFARVTYIGNGKERAKISFSYKDRALVTNKYLL